MTMPHTKEEAWKALEYELRQHDMASLGSLKELIMAFADARVDEIVRPVIATLESNSSDTVKVRLALLGLKLQSAPGTDRPYGQVFGKGARSAGGGGGVGRPAVPAGGYDG